MLIYIILVLIILILPIFKINKKKYCIIIGILMTLIVGSRSINMGMNDTKDIYVPIFYKLSMLSFSESIRYIIDSKTEIVFYALTRIYLTISTNVRIYLFLLAIPLNLEVSRIIYKYSKVPSLSFIMFFSLNYFAFSFTLLRHCIALSIVILATDCVVNKKLKKFIIMIFIAGLFHRTAWIFVIIKILQ